MSDYRDSKHISGCPHHWHPDSTQPCICAVERVVATYPDHAELIDAYSVIRIRLRQPNIKFRSELRKQGWRGGPGDSLQKASSPTAIMDAQALLRERFGEPAAMSDSNPGKEGVSSCGK